MAMKPPPVRRTVGGVGRTSVTPTAKPMPKPTFAGKKPMQVTGGAAPVQTAGARSGVGRLAKNLVASQRRLTDKRRPV